MITSVRYFLIFQLVLVFAYSTYACNRIKNDKPIQTMITHDTTGQAQIIQTYLKEGAWNYHFLSKEWQEWIDKGLEKDSTIAYLWQQKALPYWKTRRYELASACYDRAVYYDREKWLSRHAFLKCVFSKQYHSALADIEAYHKEFGETFENDHALSFYEALCYIGLAEFDKAKSVLIKKIETEERERGKNWVHHLDHFYLGICYYETNEYKKAIEEFDFALAEYDNFSDAQYWKGKSLIYLGLETEGKELILIGYENFKTGATFNEGSSPYEAYPYQLTWEWPYMIK